MVEEIYKNLWAIKDSYLNSVFFKVTITVSFEKCSAKIRYFAFTDLSLGLCSVPFIMTKIM